MIKKACAISAQCLNYVALAGLCVLNVYMGFVVSFFKNEDKVSLCSLGCLGTLT